MGIHMTPFCQNWTLFLNQSQSPEFSVKVSSYKTYEAFTKEYLLCITDYEGSQVDIHWNGIKHKSH